MSTEVETRPVVSLEKVPPLRHLFWLPRPPQPGDVALCGHVIRRVRGAVLNPALGRDHCVVCVDIARSVYGYRG